MLNKDICVRCIKIECIGDWTPMDEDGWLRGVVWCVQCRILTRTNRIPESCPYALEHILKEATDAG